MNGCALKKKSVTWPWLLSPFFLQTSSLPVDQTEVESELEKKKFRFEQLKRTKEDLRGGAGAPSSWRAPSQLRV